MVPRIKDKDVHSFVSFCKETLNKQQRFLRIMEKSDKKITTSSAPVEIIAKASIDEAEEIIENIDLVEKKRPIGDEIIETQKTIKAVENALVKGPDHCDCSCCYHNARVNRYLHTFMRDMMFYEADKYQQLRRFFSTTEEEN